jgi:hypothetical protein
VMHNNSHYCSDEIHRTVCDIHFLVV